MTTECCPDCEVPLDTMETAAGVCCECSLLRSQLESIAAPMRVGNEAIRALESRDAPPFS